MPVVYSPEELNFLHQVLDEAVNSLPVHLRTSVSKSKVAKRILDCTAAGERNRVALRIAGLADFQDARKVGGMKSRSRVWTPEQLARLKQLVGEGASAARASVVLKRSIVSVRSKAADLGMPFTTVRRIRAARLAREQLELG
jgi:hypothetical protein